LKQTENCILNKNSVDKLKKNKKPFENC